MPRLAALLLLLLAACTPPGAAREASNNLVTLCLAFDDAYSRLQGDTVRDYEVRDLYALADSICWEVAGPEGRIRPGAE